jgi:hypothetical protein
MDYVPYAVPFFLLAILIELAYGISKKNNTYRLNDAISSLFMGSLRSANKLIIIRFMANGCDLTVSVDFCLCYL